MQCWSLSTTIRNPYRLIPHLEVFHRINGDSGFGEWDTAKKRQYQIALIQNRTGKPQTRGLPDELCRKLEDTAYPLTGQDASQIYELKGYGRSVTARVNSILGHLVLWGLVEAEYRPRPGSPNREKKLSTSQAGLDILSGKLDFACHMQSMLPRWKFPNYPEGVTVADPQPIIRPFPATLALIFEVNRIAALNGLEPMGIHAYEFDLYGLTFREKRGLTEQALKIIAYRKVMQDPQYTAQQATIHAEELRRLNELYAGLYNAADYTDVVFRYFNLSQYIMLPDCMSVIDIAPEYRKEARTLADRYMQSDRE